MSVLREFFDRNAASYGHRWTIEEENRVAARELAAGPGRILEVGCGNGRILLNLPGGAVGVDFAPGMLREARTAGRGCRLVLARGEALPFRARSFDTVIAVNSLHNYVSPLPWLEEIRRLAPRRIIVDVRNAWNPVVQYKTWKYRDVMARCGLAYACYTPGGFRRTLARFGFRSARRRPVRRPLADPFDGFRWRHVIGWILSFFPGLAPSYMIEGVSA